MKKAIPTIAALCSIVILLNSCATGKNSITIQKPDVENANSGPTDCYIQFTDGSVKHYSTLKLVTGILTTPHLLADNKTVINTKDIKAYQNSKLYAVSANSLKTTKTSYVALEALPGFAVRLVQGKLNVYHRKFYNGNNAVDEYFLQTGDEGEILAFSAALVKELIKDNAKALDFFNSKAKISPKSQKLLTAVIIYNTGEFLSKN